MSATAKKRVLDHLFGSEETQLLNFKLFRGDNKDLSTEELCEELNATLTRAGAGRLKRIECFDRDQGIKKVNLRDLV